MTFLETILTVIKIAVAVIAVIGFAVLGSVYLEYRRERKLLREGKNPYLEIAKDRKPRESQRDTEAGK